MAKECIGVLTRAVDPQLFFAVPDPAVFFNADPHADADPKPALQNFILVSISSTPRGVCLLLLLLLLVSAFLFLTQSSF